MRKANGNSSRPADKLPNAVAMTAACCAALATLVPVALYQTGVIQHLPDPPLPVFDSDRITLSKMAHPLGVPDALLGLGSFCVTLALILISRNHRPPRKMLGAKLALDGAAATFNMGRQVIRFRSLCSWCTGTALAAGIMAASGRRLIPETGKARTRARRSQAR